MRNKKRTKRVFTLLLAACLLFNLVGCGKKPTARSLLENMRLVEPDGYVCVALSVDVSADSDAGSGNIGIDGKLEYRSGIAHMYDVKLSLGMSGFSVDGSAEAWMDVPGDMVYMKMDFMDQSSGWTKQAMSEASGPVDLESMAKIPEDVLAGAVLADHKSGDDYVVTWDMSLEELGSVMDGVTGGLGGGVGTAGDGMMHCTATFDGKTEALKSMQASFGNSEAGMDGTVSVNVLERNSEKELFVPQDVLGVAVDSYASPGMKPTQDAGSVSDGDVDWPQIDQSRYNNDGKGMDPVLDPLASSIMVVDPDYAYVSVSHDTDSSRLHYSCDKDDWMGSISIERMASSDGWGRTKQSFQDRCADLFDWYGLEPYLGGADSDHVLCVVETADNTVDGYAAFYQNEFYVECEVYDFETTDADAIAAHVEEMLALCGFSEVWQLD